MLSVGEEAAAQMTVPTRQNFTESTAHVPSTADKSILSVHSFYPVNTVTGNLATEG